MYLYLRVRGRCALYMEFFTCAATNKLIDINSFDNETIIDIPFMRIIYTPLGKDNNTRARNADKPDRCIFDPPAGTAKD